MGRFWARTGILFGVLLLGLLLFVPEPSFSQEEEREESEKEIRARMKRWAKALGVKCTYCHVRRKFKVWTPMKRTGHWMEENITKKLVTKDGHKTVTCADCHNGETEFLPHHKEEDD